MASPPHGTVTFLLTDVEGSTRLWEQHPEGMREALACHDAILRSLIDAHGGYVFSTAGDAFAGAFWTPREAVEAAGEAQRELATQNWPEAVALRVRMGLHTGTADERDGNYFGPAVNRAARIMAVAHGGQVLVSAATAALLGEEGLVNLGVHRLKDLSAPEHVYQVGVGTHPPLRTLDRVPHNLPVQRTELFGRETELERAIESLRANRLVTLTGLGGAGKTRLALAAGALVIDEFPDGVWLVDLVPVTEPDRVPAAIAEAVSLRLDADRPATETLRVQLSDRRLLLVLDNCEHVTDAVADVVDELLDGTTAVRVLATSREPLDLPDERVMAVPPLSAEGGVSSPAVALFVARAGRAGAAVDADELNTVAEICRRLDGLPLAIELAAAQLAHLPPRQLLDRLDRRLELLAAGRGRRHQRQSSLQTVLESTWGLLGGDERELLGQLTVFPSTFDLDTVEGVCTSPTLPSPLPSLRGLVNRALVAPVTIRPTPEFRLLETVKLFAHAKFSAEGERFRDRHLEWFARQVGDTPDEEQYTSLAFAGRVHRVYEDLRSASRHALQRSDLDVAARLIGAGGLYWHVFPSARSLDGLRRADELLTLGLPPEIRARLHLAAALAGMGARSPQRIADDSELAVEDAAAAGVPAVEAMALCVASWIPALRGPEAGLTILDQSERVALAAEMPRLAAGAASYRAVFLGLAGRLEDAAELSYPMSMGYRGEPDYAVRCSFSALWAVVLLRDPHLATTAAETIISHTEDAGLPASWLNVFFLAGSYAATGRFSEAVMRVEEAATLAHRTGADDGFPDLLLVPAVAAYTQGDLRRASTLVNGIKRAGRPTQNFLATIVYRQLRRELASIDPEPTSLDLAMMYADARHWLATHR